AGRTPEQGFFVRSLIPRVDSDAPPSGVAITLRGAFAPERPNEFVIYDFRFRETTMTTDVVPVASAERRLGGRRYVGPKQAALALGEPTRPVDDHVHDRRRTVGLAFARAFSCGSVEKEAL